jgi:hypothetical protein
MVFLSDGYFDKIDHEIKDPIHSLLRIYLSLHELEGIMR